MSGLPFGFMCAMARIVIWVIGCVVFDGILQWSGPWLMLGGAIAYAVGDMTDATIRALVKA